MQLAPAPCAAQQSAQQSLAAAHRKRRVVLHKVTAIVAHDVLVALVLVPINIAGMVVWDKHAGRFRRASTALLFDRFAVLDHHLDRATSIDIGACVDGIVQHAVDKAQCRSLPTQLKAIPARFVDRQLDALFVKPAMRLADTGELCKLAEHQRHCLLHAQVRIFDCLTDRVHHITRR